jgi:LDH2 family malate/lactate/ureidoglycolate dehydrogenase
MAENNLVRVPFEDLKNFCKQAYLKAGVPAEEAEIVADPSVCFGCGR